ncbi:hypothetical protein [Streptomyces sp. NPDC058664]|uniref:hypothetical protein n=1 Tax=unclassified Streptomyces TaxID=2593676 RepID=UPI00364D656F
MELRRALSVIAVLSTLLAGSACSNASTESGDGKPKAGTPGTGNTLSPEEKAAAEAKRIGAVDPVTLEKVVLSGKKSGFEAKEVAKSQVEAGRDMKADNAVCQPLASLAGGYTHLPAIGVVHRSLDPIEAKNATVGSMWLASHSEKDAQRVMSDLRASLKACPKGFKTVGLAYTGVQSVKAPALGDEAVGYRITSVVGGQKVPMTYTVVRQDGVIAAFYGVNMLTPQASAIPDSLVKAQLDQLG